MRDEFDLDQSKPNPYEEVDNCESLFYISFSLLIDPQTLLWPS